MGLTHLSLFSGYGGLDIAAHWAGFETVGLCEWADYPHELLKKRFKGVPIWRDIRTLTGDDFYQKTGLRTVTVISGGFPCQPFSVAGKREGMLDDRYLWPEMLRVIEEIRPTWVIGENVAGITTMAEPEGDIRVESSVSDLFGDRVEEVRREERRGILYGIIRDLEQIGYSVQTFIVPACAANAPHRRDRIAIVAHS